MSYVLCKDGKKREATELTCTQCSKTFIRLVKQAKAKYNNFCSHKCHNEYRQQTNLTYLCHTCGNEVIIKKSRLKCSDSGLIFCTRKCKDMWRRKPKMYCVVCGKQLNNKSTTNVCMKCCKDYNYKTYISRWKNGLETGYVGGKYNDCITSQYIRKYLFEIYKSKCSKCGWGETNKLTNKVPLTIHHIDGNYANNTENNLDLLCPNCHALTENYGSNGNGRPKRAAKFNGAIV